MIYHLMIWLGTVKPTETKVQKADLITSIVINIHSIKKILVREVNNLKRLIQLVVRLLSKKSTLKVHLLDHLLILNTDLL